MFLPLNPNLKSIFLQIAFYRNLPKNCTDRALAGNPDRILTILEVMIYFEHPVYYRNINGDLSLLANMLQITQLYYYNKIKLFDLPNITDLNSMQANNNLFQGYTSTNYVYKFYQLNDERSRLEEIRFSKTVRYCIYEK